MTYCSHCGAANKDTSRFCNNCSATLTAPFDVRCAVCGSVNDAESPSCRTCGARLRLQPSAASKTDSAVNKSENPALAVTSPLSAESPRSAANSDEIPEWLAELEAAVPVIEAKSVVAETAPQTTAPTLSPSAPLPDWLLELQRADGDGQGEPVSSIDSNAGSAGSSPEPEWDTPSSTGSKDENNPPAGSDDEELPAWLRALTLESSEANTEPGSKESAPPAPVADSSSPSETTASTAPSDSLPDWLRGFTPPYEGVKETAAPSTSPESPLPDWVQEPVAAPPSEPPVAAQEKQIEVPAPVEIPMWMTPPKVTTGPLVEHAESKGPLAGIPGVIPIAPAVTQPHRLAPAPPPRGSGGRIFESVLAGQEQAHAGPASRSAASGKRSRLTYLIYALVMLAAVAALFIPLDWAGLGLGVTNRTPTAAFFDKVHGLPVGSTVLLSFDYEPGQAVELDPAARVILRDLAQRRVNAIALSTTQAGAQIAQSALDEASKNNSSWRPGTNYVNLGFIPGGDVAVRKLAENWVAPTQLDFNKQPLSSSQLTSQLRALRDVALVIEFAGGDPSLRTWMEQAQPRHDTSFVAVVTAAIEASARNYLSSNQLVAYLRGQAGAAEYELFLNQPGLNVRTLDAQSLVHLVILLLIVVGNLVFWTRQLIRFRSSQPAKARV